MLGTGGEKGKPQQKKGTKGNYKCINKTSVYKRYLNGVPFSHFFSKEKKKKLNRLTRLKVLKWIACLC